MYTNNNNNYNSNNNTKWEHKPLPFLNYIERKNVKIIPRDTALILLPHSPAEQLQKFSAGVSDTTWIPLTPYYL